MADEYDYTRDIPGVYVPHRDPDDSGVYILEEPRMLARRRGGSAPPATPRSLTAYDDCTRQLWANPQTHPRSTWAGQGYPGPMGAGRREGFGRAERRFVPAAARSYARGSPVYGYPGFRGLVSARGVRPTLDDLEWDPRPARYSAGRPVHGARMSRGAWQSPVPGVKDTAEAAPSSVPSAGMDWSRTERFCSACTAGQGGLLKRELAMVVFLVVVVLLASRVVVQSTKKALLYELRCVLREAFLLEKLPPAV